jgi:translocation and assembly module TamB
MTRRRRVFVAFCLTVAGLLAVFAGSVAILTRTDWGRAKALAFAVETVNRGIQGRLYIGTISGSIFTGLQIDTLEIRDRNDSLFVALARVDLQYDPRDLLDRRLLFHRVRLGRVTANIFEDSIGMLNFRRIFPSGPPGQAQEPSRQAWGQFIKLEDVVVESAQVTLTTRWSPGDSTVPRSVLDSITTFNLQRTDKVIWRGPGTLYETRQWTNGRIELDSARLDDRQPGGRKFAIRQLAIDESYPPFRFRNARGFVRILGDSIWSDVPHFELPGSAGSMSGKVWWGPNQPTRFDLVIEGDTVSLADIAWIYPTLPTEGGGRMNLMIRSERDPRIIDYVITDMDVRTIDSRLRGDMTFGVGAPVTILKDVDITAQPVDFRLIEHLSGEPLPYPWRGTISGSLIASGGPLDNFMVDSSDLVFRDANVPGAVTIGQLRGRMDILKPSEVVFNGLDVDLDQLDLRTLQFLVPAFPRLNGLVAGTATLDSSWLDVRFREADLTHTDGSGPPTRLVGNGRVTFGETTTTYDVAMTAQPFSFTTFSRAYTETHIPLKGEYTGPLRIQGTTDDLFLATELRGPAGLLAYDGRVDGDSIGGYALEGQLRFENLDLRTLLDTAVTPVTALTGVAALAVRGDSLFNLVGATDLDLDRSRIDSVVVHDGARLRLRFADGRMRVFGTDTVETAVGRVLASGGLGLGASVRDSMTVEFRVDTLGSLRRYLRAAPGDSVQGSIEGLMVLSGNVDTLNVRGVATGYDVVLPGIDANEVRLTPALTNVTRSLGGEVVLHADTLSLGGVHFQDIDGRVALEAGRPGSYSVLATETNGPVIESSGAVRIEGDTTNVVVEALSIMLDQRRFTLDRPATVRVEPQLILVDTLVLVTDGDAAMRFSANVPDSLPLNVRLVLESLPLADLSVIAQRNLPVGGELTAALDVNGTRGSPVMTATGTLNSVTAGDVTVAQIAANARYENGRVSGEGRVVQADTTVLTVDGSYPIDLALLPRDNRFPADTMRLRVRAPNVGLAILESFTTAVRSASGTLTANAELAGMAGRAMLNGQLAVNSGQVTLPLMGITLRRINADLTARNDTLVFDTLTMVSGPENTSTFSTSGWIAHPLNPDSVAFDLGLLANEFHAIGRRTIADLYVTANVQWRGTDLNSTATGVVSVDRGDIALPETTDKDLYAVPDWRELGLDSTVYGRLGLVPQPATRFLRGLSAENVRVVMGPDVWLKSQDANIKLAGSVNLRVARSETFTEDQLVLTGDLQTERGTYRLNVSPLQRTFQVEQGTLRFFGDPGFNPSLDIRAVYTSRTTASHGGRNDVRVGVHLTGTLASPRAELYAADSLLGLSQSDLLSYVLFDQPSFSVGTGTSSAMALILNSLSSLASSQASRIAGGWLDVVQLQTGTQYGVPGLGIGSAFQGAQLAVGRQFGDRFFLSLTSGLCVANSAAAGPRFTEGLGVRAEYRFGRTSDAGVAFAYEPSFDRLICSGVVDQFNTSKKQIGLDFFRIWRR